MLIFVTYNTHFVCVLRLFSSLPSYRFLTSWTACRVPTQGTQVKNGVYTVCTSILRSLYLYGYPCLGFLRVVFGFLVPSRRIFLFSKSILGDMSSNCDFFFCTRVEMGTVVLVHLSDHLKTTFSFFPPLYLEGRRETPPQSPPVPLSSESGRGTLFLLCGHATDTSGALLGFDGGGGLRCSSGVRVHSRFRFTLDLKMEVTVIPLSRTKGTVSSRSVSFGLISQICSRSQSIVLTQVKVYFYRVVWFCASIVYVFLFVLKVGTLLSLS